MSDKIILEFDIEELEMILRWSDIAETESQMGDDDSPDNVLCTKLNEILKTERMYNDVNNKRITG